MEVKKMTKEWEIWNKKEEEAKLEEEAKKSVPLRFHKQIHIFAKKVSERMLTKKVQNYMIELKEGFILRKRMYLLSREEKCTSLLKNN